MTNQRKPVAKVSHVNVAIPQAGATHNKLHVECEERQQSSAVKSPIELVTPGNVS